MRKSPISEETVHKWWRNSGNKFGKCGSQGGIDSRSLSRPRGGLNATYSYLRCCHRLCEKGDGSFIWKSMQRIQESQVNIRLPLISFISFLPHIGFWSIWAPRKAVFKENLTLLRARRLEKNSWRT